MKQKADITQAEWHPVYGFNTEVHLMTRREYKRRVVARIASDRRKRKGVMRMPEEQAELVAKFPDRVAAIVGKTYAEMGDAHILADDEALNRIRDLLLEIDEEIIGRNKNKRLGRR